jgi:hypothetical protein
VGMTRRSNNPKNSKESGNGEPTPLIMISEDALIILTMDITILIIPLSNLSIRIKMGEIINPDI